MSDELLANLGIQSQPPSGGADPLLANLGIAPASAAPAQNVSRETQAPALTGNRPPPVQPLSWMEKQLAKMPDIMTPKQESMYRGFAMGAADPSVAAYQIAANAMPGKSGPQANQAIAGKEQQYQQGKDASGREGFDWSRMGGNLAVTVPATRGIAPVQGIWNSLKQGAAVGAGSGLFMPVTEGDYLTQKADQVGTGATGGAVLGPVAQVVGNTGNYLADKAEGLMQSALKPTIEQLRTGKAQTAVRTLLDEGINPTEAGVDILKTRIGDINNQVKSEIAGSTATIDKQAVINALSGTRDRFTNQVNPVGDLDAISAVENGFLNHPAIPNQTFPVQQAQDLKQGTYSVLSKKYGQLGSAETEAQKALARGLKEQISSAVPEVANLNAQESKLIDALSVTERRALMDMNKNPMGLAALAHNPGGWAAMMADKSALFKSLVARAMNQTSQAPIPGGAALAKALRENSGRIGGAGALAIQEAMPNGS